MSIELREYLSSQLQQSSDSRLKTLWTTNESQIQQLRSSSERRSRKVETFSPESRNALLDQGFYIYALTGQSLTTLQNTQRPFWLNWHEKQKFRNEPSRLSEVAVNPSQLFLPGSNRNKRIQRELDLMANYSDTLAENIPGVQAILGSVADYAELAFVHLDATGQYLFGEDYNGDFTATTTKTKKESLDLVVIGGFYPQQGITIDISRNPGGEDIWDTPLIVPTEYQL